MGKEVSTGDDRPTSNLKFLLCGQRTGSTLVTRILNSHSEIASPFEFAVPAILGRRHRKYASAVEKAQQIAAFYGIDPELIYARRVFPSRCRDIEARVRRFASLVMEREMKRYFVIKEPAHIDAAPRIIKCFGKSAIILLARGPIATACSLARSFGARDPLRAWVKSHRRLARYFEAGAPLFRYEDLIASPEPFCRRLCDVLGVAYEPAMLEYGRHAHSDDQLALWYRRKGSTELATAAASELHQTLAKGVLDQGHSRALIEKAPEQILRAYRANRYGVALVAARLGYASNGIDTLPESVQSRSAA